MSRPPLIVWGASGHARVIADAVLEGGAFELRGFVDDVTPTARAEATTGLPVFGGADRLPELLGGEGVLIIGFGNCAARLAAADRARALGVRFATVIHPRACVSGRATLGAGVFVAAGAIIGPGAVVGDHAIVNTAASVDHDCAVADGAHVCPGVRLAGRVVVGRGAWVGVGASVKDGVRIGDDAMVGAGAVVVRDVPPRVVVFGNPARIARTLDHAETHA